MYYLLNRYYSLNIIIICFSEIIIMFLTVLILASFRLSFEQSAFILYSSSLIKLPVFAITYFITFYYFDLYTPELYRPDRQMILNLSRATITASIALFSIYFLYPLLNVGLWIVIANALVLPMVIIAWRAIFTEVLSIEFPEKRVLIIGFDDLAQKVGMEIIRWYGHGLTLIGFIHDNPTHKVETKIISKDADHVNLRDNPGRGLRRKTDFKVIGGYGDIVRLIKSEKIYKIILALPEKRAKLPMSALLECKLRGVNIVEGETFYERITGRIPIEQIKPSWLVFSDGFKNLRSRKILKRIIDINVSIIGLILSSPLFALVSLLIRVDSKGPIILKQTRVGENGKEFQVYKFRSMLQDAEMNTGPVWAEKDDKRITRVGHIMREFRIDEIPQLINVFKGDMSFVGPRPERPNFVTELKEKIPYYEMRTVIKPGITGWAQIKYPYGATVKEAAEKLQYDIFYIKNMSPLMDAMIILSTIKVVIARKVAR